MGSDGNSGERVARTQEILSNLVAEHGLSVLEAMASATIEAMVLSKRGKVVFVNDRFRELIGADKEDHLQDKDVREFVSPNERENVFDHVHRGDTLPYETVLLGKHNDEIPVFVSPSFLTVDGEQHRLAGFLDLRPIKERDRTIRRALHSTAFSLSRAIEARDPYTAGHMDRVAYIGCQIAQKLQMKPDDVDAIDFGCRVHDIGKLGVPVEILTKPGKLEPWEWNSLQQHPAIGASILEGIEFPWPVREIVLYHHERCDGSGYPEGLGRHELCPVVHIVAVADALEAITGVRPYHRYRSFDEAIGILKKETDRYDEDVLGAAADIISSGSFKDMEFRGADPLP